MKDMFQEALIEVEGEGGTIPGYGGYSEQPWSEGGRERI